MMRGKVIKVKKKKKLVLMWNQRVLLIKSFGKIPPLSAEDENLLQKRKRLSFNKSTNPNSTSLFFIVIVHGYMNVMF